MFTLTRLRHQISFDFSRFAASGDVDFFGSESGPARQGPVLNSLLIFDNV
jgi:hypothetical protein